MIVYPMKHTINCLILCELCLKSSDVESWKFCFQMFLQIDPESRDLQADQTTESLKFKATNNRFFLNFL